MMVFLFVIIICLAYTYLADKYSTKRAKEELAMYNNKVVYVGDWHHYFKEDVVYTVVDVKYDMHVKSVYYITESGKHAFASDFIFYTEEVAKELEQKEEAEFVRKMEWAKRVDEQRKINKKKRIAKQYVFIDNKQIIIDLLDITDDISKLDDALVQVYKCKKRIADGANQEEEILFTVFDIETILDVNFTEKQYDEYYKMIEKEVI